MKTKITDYRGFEISFDTEQERFYVFSDSYDTESTKPSFASCKKYIDDFIKDNKVFKPFKAEKFATLYSNTEVITIVGIRKDGRFVYETDSLEKKQLGDYDESFYFLINQENEPIKKELEALNKQYKDIGDKIKNKEKELIKVSIKDIKKDYKP